jgi:soluble lytic murein transglycosylase-like protein
VGGGRLARPPASYRASRSAYHGAGGCGLRGLRWTWRQRRLWRRRTVWLLRLGALGALAWLALVNWPRVAPRPTPTGYGIWSPEVAAAAAATNLSPALIAAVMVQESGGNPNAVSRAGARGLMQLMPTTARTLGVSDINNPMQNLLGGARYLAQLLSGYQQDYHACLLRQPTSGPCLDPLVLALAAYNAGPAAVAKYGGIPPYPETRQYVLAVLTRYAANLQAEARAAGAR